MAEETKTNEAVQEPIAAPAAEPVQPGQPEAGTQEVPTAPELNISDLNTVKSIIDIATSRGAFKPNELEAVGKTYNKLSTFLEHVSKQAQTNQEKQGEK
jgi:hypothetical protein